MSCTSARVFVSEEVSGAILLAAQQLGINFLTGDGEFEDFNNVEFVK